MLSIILTSLCFPATAECDRGHTDVKAGTTPGEGAVLETARLPARLGTDRPSSYCDTTRS